MMFQGMNSASLRKKGWHSLRSGVLVFSGDKRVWGWRFRGVRILYDECKEMLV